MRLKYLLLLFPVLLATSCTVPTRVPYNPFRVPLEEFYGKIGIITLAPLAVPEGLTDRSGAREKFEELISGKLRGAGFSVVDSKEYDEIWKREVEREGGYFDPITGKRDQSKLKAIVARTRQELISRYKMDAVLYSHIRVVRATFWGNWAQWDENGESLGKPERNAQLYGRSETRGTVAALSLVVFIEDKEEKQMYLNAGGIQVLAKFGLKKEFVPIPEEEILTNQEMNEWAVTRALDPLIKRAVPRL